MNAEEQLQDDELIFEMSPELSEIKDMQDKMAYLFTEQYIQDLLKEYNPTAKNLTLRGDLKSMVYFLSGMLDEFEKALNQISSVQDPITNHVSVIKADDEFEYI